MGLRQKPIQEYRPTEESKAAPKAGLVAQGDPGNGTLAHLIERGDQGTGFCQG